MITRRDVLAWGLGATALAGAPRSWSAQAGRGAAIDEQIERDIRGWDAIVQHRTGTPGDAATSRWLADEIRQAGATPEVSTFAFVRRVPGQCTVTNGTWRSTGLPLFDGGVTPPEGISGNAGPLGSSAAVGVTPFGPSPRNPGSRALLDARRNTSHRAIVAYASGEDGMMPGLGVLNAESYLAPYGPPVLQAPMETRGWLEEAARRGRPVTVQVLLEAEETSAGNVTVTIEGSNPGLEPLVIMTPKSAWWTCTAERAGGITIWLNAIRHFAANRPARTVIFTANTGHELGHVGLDRYLEANRTLIRGARAWIHLGANFASRDAPILFQASTETLMRDGLNALGSAGFPDPQTTQVGQRPLGEARNIHDGGGNYISLLGANPWFHQPEDRWPTTVDLNKTVRLTNALLELATELARA